MTAAFVPVIICLLVMVVVYYMMRELFDHRVALLSSFMSPCAWLEEKSPAMRP